MTQPADPARRRPQSSPTTMRAATQHRYGRPEDVVADRRHPGPGDRPRRRARPGEVGIGQRGRLALHDRAADVRQGGARTAPAAPDRRRHRRRGRRRRDRVRRDPLPGGRRGLRRGGRRRLRRVRRRAGRLAGRQAAGVVVRGGRRRWASRPRPHSRACATGACCRRDSGYWSTAPPAASAPSPSRSPRRSAPPTSPRSAAPTTSRPRRASAPTASSTTRGRTTAGPASATTSSSTTPACGRCARAAGCSPRAGPT